jgi:cytochrome c
VFYLLLSDDSYLKCATWNTEYGLAGYLYALRVKVADLDNRVESPGQLLHRNRRILDQVSLLLASLLLSLNVAAIDADAAQGLAKHSGCNKCHAVEKKKDGPALRDVAAKYRGDPAAEEKLIKHVTSGEMVKFDDGHKEEHKKVKTQDPDQTKNLIDWILSLEGGTKY